MLTASAIGGIGLYTYAWTGPNGFTANTPVINIPNALVANSGIYQVTVTDANLCQAISTALVQVAPCTIPLTVSITPPITQVTAGDPINLTALVSDGTAPFTYSWTGPNGFTANTPAINIPNALVANSGNYLVTVTDAFGCFGTATALVQVDPCTIPLTVSITPPITQVTVGSPIQLTASVSDGTAPFTYSWTGPNGFTANTSVINIPNATLAQSGNYQVTVTDAFGCLGSATALVTVQPNVLIRSLLSQAIHAKYCQAAT